MDERSNFSTLTWLDLSLPTPEEVGRPTYIKKIEERGIIDGKLGPDTGYSEDHEPEFVYSSTSKIITPTTDCVLKEGSVEGHEAFINTFEFTLEENQIVHQIFLNSKAKYLVANLYCDGILRLDWYTEHEEIMAEFTMTPRQHEMYNKMVDRKPLFEGQEVIHILPLRAGKCSEQIFHSMSKLYKNWKIEYEFSDQTPNTSLRLGYIVRRDAE